MNAEFDYDLTPDQWEALKALRASAAKSYRLNRSALADLIALRLATMTGDHPVLTPTGRSVLLRGSPRLLDLAA